jgi:hypothetical protein
MGGMTLTKPRTKPSKSRNGSKSTGITVSRNGAGIQLPREDKKQKRQQHDRIGSFLERDVREEQRKRGKSRSFGGEDGWNGPKKKENGRNKRRGLAGA